MIKATISFVIILTVSLFSQNAFTQPSSSARNTIYAELLGPGLLYSLNYDRMMTENLSGRIGFSMLNLDAGKPGEPSKVNVTTIPVTLNYLYGKRNHKLELSGGLVFITASQKFDGVSSIEGSGSLATAGLAYRYHPVNGGLNFRLGVSPIFDNNMFLTWGGVSLGYSF